MEGQSRGGGEGSVGCIRRRPPPRLRQLAGALALAMLVAALIVELAYEPPPAAAATITIPALKDNTLYNDGVEESNGAGSYMFAGRTKDGFLRRAVAAFDVAAAVPAGSTITNATLTLNLSRSNQASTETVTMQRLDASWGEGTSSADKQEGKGAPATAGDATWTYRFFSTTPWTTPGGDFSTTISASAAVGSSNGPYSWSSPQLTADVQSMLDNPSTNHGWIVIGNETTNGTAKRFDTRENNTASARPGLSIEYVPPLNTPTPTDTPAFSPTPTLTPTVTSTPTATVTPTATPTSAFTTPLYSPPVLTDANINISIEEACIQILPGPCTNMWTYGGTFPGPTIRRPTGQTTNVTFTNNLPVEAGAVSVHNHGNHSSPVHDGRPNDFLIGPGESRTYVYEHIEDRGNERGTTQFYHDHVMDLTARNVWYGLAGFYIIDDSADPSTLPSGAFDIPLAIADRQFDAQNQIPYTFLSSGVTGDHFLVNGVYQPYLDVGDRQYRFRILNASNARTYNLALSSAQSFTQVGTESGLLPSPVARMDMRIGTGERTDVVIDFAGLLGQDVFLVDTLTGTSLLKFRVTEDLVDDSFVPATLRPLPDIGEPEVTRTFNFGSTAGHWTINGLRFDPNRYDAQPVLGTTEKWVFQNLGSVAHTIHLHDVDQICMSRDDGPCLPYEPMKDTWFLGPNEKLEVKLKFTDHTGPYVFHCHILEHEDDGMMAQFEVITPMSTATPPPSTTPTATSTATATPTSTATNTPPATDTATATSTQASPTVTSTATATPTEIATASPSPIRSLTATATAVATDSDGDGCDDVVELGPDHVLGGQRDPFNFWDFYDVTGDSSIDLTDTLAILGHFGHGPSDDTFDQLADRFIPNVAEPWRTGESNDGLDLTDALNSLASFGDSCGV